MVVQYGGGMGGVKQCFSRKNNTKKSNRQVKMQLHLQQRLHIDVNKLWKKTCANIAYRDYKY